MNSDIIDYYRFHIIINIYLTSILYNQALNKVRLFIVKQNILIPRKEKTYTKNWNF